MRGNFWCMLLVCSLLTSMAIVSVVVGTGAASSETVLRVNPKTNVAAPDETFVINITLTNVANLYFFQVNMTFDPTILNCTNVAEGPFLATAGDTWWQEVTIDNYGGWVFFGNSLFPAPPNGATGNGTLALVTFNVAAEGRSDLQFDSLVTKLRTLDEEGVSQPIEHKAVDGDFIYPLHRDVAVTELSASSSPIESGQLVHINVTVKNEGDINETFSVDVLYDSTEIDSKIVTDLPPDGLETLSFSWDTTGVDADTYTIKAVAGLLSGETDIEDNTKSVSVTVTAPPSNAIPIEFLVGIIIIAAAIACVVIFLYTRRRRLTKA